SRSSTTCWTWTTGRRSTRYGWSSSAEPGRRARSSRSRRSPSPARCSRSRPWPLFRIEPSLQKSALGLAGIEVERPAVGLARLRGAAGAAEETATGGVIVHVGVEAVDPLDGGQADLGPLGHRERDRAVELDHRRRLMAEELVVQEDDLRPVALLTCVTGGDRGLELVGARCSAAQRGVDERAALLDLGGVPPSPVLVLQQHDHAV